MKILKNILKNETVFCVAFLLAVLSSLAVHPDKTYYTYPDYRTIALLFCLMIIVSGFRAKGVFTLLGHALLHRAHSLKGLSCIMITLCFFSSMLITNDVTLITFVPFTMLVCRMIGQVKQLVKLVVLETIAANLGSMATPVGNPQNLYLYSISGLSVGEFAWAVLPYAGFALFLLYIAVFIGKDVPLLGVKSDEKLKTDKKSMLTGILPYFVLLILCLLVVFRVLPYIPVLICVAVVIFIVDRRLYLEVDYFLLLTFLFFFIFVGNMKRLPEINAFLSSVVEHREMLTGVLASQIISNVPAAILLSGFTKNFSALLTGVNLGGLGTLIASLASLISYKIFTKEYTDQKGKFMLVFTAWNLIFLLLLCAEAFVLYRL